MSRKTKKAKQRISIAKYKTVIVKSVFRFALINLMITSY